jgi:hypothetical protein
MSIDYSKKQFFRTSNIAVFAGFAGFYTLCAILL